MKFFLGSDWWAEGTGTDVGAEPICIVPNSKHPDSFTQHENQQITSSPFLKLFYSW